MNIYIKDYFEGKDDLNSEICALASYIILILHELALYIRIYIYKKTNREIYRKSFNLCINNEIGKYLEELLFGNVISSINLNQALFLLNIDNYQKPYKNFKENYQSFGENEIQENNFNDFEKAKVFLNELGLHPNEEDISKIPMMFQIKGDGSNFFLGYNNDKTGRSFDLKDIFAGTGFECLLNKNK